MPTRSAAAIQPPGRDCQRDFGTQPGAGPQLQFRAEALGALTHALQAPMAMAGVLVGNAGTVVAHVQQKTTRAIGQFHFNGTGIGMAQRIADGLAPDQEHLFGRVGLQRWRRAFHGQLLTPGMQAGGWSALCLLAVLMLVLGALTPLAALMAAVGMFAQQAPWPQAALPLALLMLGPGAYSLDARLFGRRLLGRRPPPFG